MSIGKGIPPVCLAVLLAAPAARGGETAYVYAEPDPAVVFSTITNANTYNFTQPVTSESITRGLTAIRFGDRWPNLRDRINIQVTGYGWARGIWGDPSEGQGDCGIAGWHATNIEVECVTSDGERVNRRFLLLALRPNLAETDRIAFAVLNRPTEASYLVDEQRFFGTGTGRATRTGVGQYSINLTTPTGVATTENTVQATALESDAQCNVLSWSFGNVHVRCQDLLGNPLDSQVSVLAISNRMPGLSFVWNNTAAGSVSAAYSHASDGVAQTVTRTGAGDYAVHLGPEAVASGHVQVTAYGSNAYCWITGWGDRVANVRCARGGVPTDSRFTAMALRSHGVVDARTWGGTTPTGAVICPSELIGGDREFGGNGPEVRVNASVGPSADRSRLELNVTFWSTELRPDFSQTVGRLTRTLFVAPPGRAVGVVLTDPSDMRAITGSGSPVCCGNESWLEETYSGADLIQMISAVGDTDGDDISTDANCANDTRLQQLRLNQIRFVLN